jgi:uncharacterized protein YecT (DUF1311 family)
MLKQALVLTFAFAATPTGAQTQAQVIRTADQRYKSADAAIAREWTAANSFMKKRDSADRSRGGGFGYAAALLASQRAWFGYRDAQCVIAGGEYAGGSMQAMARFGCLADFSRERGKQLAALRWRG